MNNIRFLKLGEAIFIACRAREQSVMYITVIIRVLNSVIETIAHSFKYAIPADNYMFKVNNRNPRARYEILSKWKPPEVLCKTANSNEI